MRSGRGDDQLRPPGFPIRTSSDHSLVADSPRLIAGSNVLHRLLVPRHPPCALSNLANTTNTDASRPLCSSQDTDGTRPLPLHPQLLGPSRSEAPGLHRFPQILNSVLTWPLLANGPFHPRSRNPGRTSHRQLGG